MIIQFEMYFITGKHESVESPPLTHYVRLKEKEQCANEKPSIKAEQKYI